MARQFDIVENLNVARRNHYPFLVVLQHDRVAALRSIIAAPLVETAVRLTGSRLHPSITISGRTYVIVVEELAAVEPNSLGRVITSAESIRYEIIAAIDFLFTGI
ncbi:MAG TPA: CcdB family protein [Xanthobacteraceae bacterium]|nr:CcdB family protein [Xanthobacteraceae bacterium]